MRYLTLNEVLAVHDQVMRQSEGAVGVLSLAALESALAQSRMTCGGAVLYPTLVEKAAAPGTFVDCEPSLWTVTSEQGIQRWKFS
jgi:death-on-curing protein